MLFFRIVWRGLPAGRRLLRQRHALKVIALPLDEERFGRRGRRGLDRRSRSGHNDYLRRRGFLGLVAEIGIVIGIREENRTTARVMSTMEASRASCDTAAHE